MEMWDAIAAGSHWWPLGETFSCAIIIIGAIAAGIVFMAGMDNGDPDSLLGAAKCIRFIQIASVLLCVMGLYIRGGFAQEWREKTAFPFIASLPEQKFQLEKLEIAEKEKDGYYGYITYKNEKGETQQIAGVFSPEKGNKDEVSFRSLEWDLGNAVDKGKYMAKVTMSSVAPMPVKQVAWRGEEIKDGLPAMGGSTSKKAMWIIGILEQISIFALKGNARAARNRELRNAEARERAIRQTQRREEPAPQTTADSASPQIALQAPEPSKRTIRS